MVSPTLINSRHQPYPVLACKSRLLIVSDSVERLTGLRAPLAVGDVEITGVSSPEVMCSACRGGYDLVVVDVSSESISGVLKVLRGCEGCAKIPVLVEAYRLTADSRLAGSYIHPLVRLHALRDYYSMAAMVGERPDLRLTINRLLRSFGNLKTIPNAGPLTGRWNSRSNRLKLWRPVSESTFCKTSSRRTVTWTHAAPVDRMGHSESK